MNKTLICPFCKMDFKSPEFYDKHVKICQKIKDNQYFEDEKPKIIEDNDDEIIETGKNLVKNVKLDSNPEIILDKDAKKIPELKKAISGMQMINKLKQKRKELKNQKTISDLKNDIIQVEMSNKFTGKKRRKPVKLETMMREEVKLSLDFMVNRTYESIYLGSNLVEESINKFSKKLYCNGFVDKVKKEEKEYKLLISRALCANDSITGTIMKYITKYPATMLLYKTGNDLLFSLKRRDELKKKDDEKKTDDVKTVDSMFF